MMEGRGGRGREVVQKWECGEARMAATGTAVTIASKEDTARLIVEQEKKSVNISSLLLSSLSLLVSTAFSTLGLHPFAY